MEPISTTQIPSTNPAIPTRRHIGPPASAPAAARHFAATLAFETDPADLAADMAAGVTGLVVVDTRQPEAYAARHLRGAVNLPHETIDERTVADLDPGALHVAYCWGPACNAGARGAANLASLGFRVKLLTGGIEAWGAEGFAVEGSNVPASADRPVESCAC